MQNLWISKKIKHLPGNQYPLNKIKMQEPKMEKRIQFLIGKWMLWDESKRLARLIYPCPLRHLFGQQPAWYQVLRGSSWNKLYFDQCTQIPNAQFFPVFFMHDIRHIFSTRFSHISSLTTSLTWNFTTWALRTTHMYILTIFTILFKIKSILNTYFACVSSLSVSQSKRDR